MGGFVDNATLIFETLKKEILNLEIKPGEPVVEAEVCKRFSTSRTPVRTAFHRLSDAGLLETVRYKGSRAPLINGDIVRQLIFMRIALEEKILLEYIDIYDQFSIADAFNFLKKQELSLEIEEFSFNKFYEDDAAFHRIWFNRTKKDYLWNHIQNINIDYTRFKKLDIVSIFACSEILKEHRQMLEAIESKNKKQIKKINKDHLNGGIRRLSSMMETEYASYFVK